MRRCKACGEKHRSFEVCDKHHDLYSLKALKPLLPLGITVTYAHGGKVERMYLGPRPCPECGSDDHLHDPTCTHSATTRMSERYPRCDACGRPRATCNLAPCAERLAKSEPKVGVPVSDPVKHPAHYTSHPSGIECIEIVRHHNFPVGNAIKYLWRQGLKDGESSIKDLRKAIQYIEFEIETQSKGTP